MEEEKNKVLVISVVAFVCSIAIIGLCLHCRKKRRAVFLIKICANESTERIEILIMKRLKRNIKKKCLNLVVRPWDQNLDNGQQPVIVFCALSSRIGVDIENAMKGVNETSPVILVLLHFKLKDLLTDNLSDDDALLDPRMKDRMAGIAHFAFSEREGLYACPQNKLGRKHLVDSVRNLMDAKKGQV